MRRFLFTLLLATFVSAAPSSQSSYSFSFPPFDQWRAAVLSGDFSALARLYSQSPEPQLSGLDRKPIALPDELAFWSSWKSQGLAKLSADLIRESDPQPDLHLLVLQLTLTLEQNPAPKKEFIAIVQGWLRQNDRWSLFVVQRTAATRLPPP